ncbi:hypothetical protein FQP87_20930 [Vibrio tasmaniensis]|nr:hypothetical protein FQP88_15970 [Vibrio atlanticus]TVU69390.1 hypothetical protein FQP87_20930 [Vibrio tasmaniensis]
MIGIMLTGFVCTARYPHSHQHADHKHPHRRVAAT